jgi:hypothetical protein
MGLQKLSGDCTQEVYNRVKKICEQEQRTISSFVRYACLKEVARFEEMEVALK